MGSRTSSSMRSLVGKKRRGKRGGTGGGGSAIASGVDDASETLSSSVSMGESGASSTGGSGFISGAGGAVATVAAGAAFAAPIKAAVGAIATSKPSLEIAYHTLKYADTIYHSIPNLLEGYKAGSTEVYTKLASSPTQFPLRVAESMVVDEVADFAWSNIKSGAEAQAKMCIHTTPHQDRVAKFIIGQAIGLALNMLKQKLMGGKIDKDFFYKQAIGAALEYYLDGVMQSSSDAANNPNASYNNLNPLFKKAMHTSVKEAAKELADHIYDDIKEDTKFPDKSKFKRIVKKNVEEKYELSVDIMEYEGDNGAKPRTIYVTDQNKILESVGNSVVLSTETSVNKKEIESKDRLWFWSENDAVQNSLQPIHHDILNIASAISRLEHLYRSEKRDENVYPKKTVIKSHTEISDETTAIINQIATFLLGFNPRILVERSERKEPEVKEVKEEVDAVVLFSGGLDSIAGVEYAKKNFKRIKYVYVNNQVGKISTFVRKLQREMDLKDDLIIFQTQPGGKFLQQTRGFSFLTAALVVADVYKAKHIIVSECGVTKYQPNINVADEITKTTHPLMISMAEVLFEKMNMKKDIHFPFNKNTKAEIIASVKNPLELKNSRSCRTSLIFNKSKPECGHCFGCLLKHISYVYITGKDHNGFLIDPITNKDDVSVPHCGNSWKLKPERYEPIMSLISFCETILADKTCLHSVMLELMKQYKTETLFYRHAEDMIYGLMFMKQKKMVKNEKVLARLEKIEKSKWFDSTKIKSRREEIINKK